MNELIAEIKSTLLNKSQKLNTAILRRSWFQTSTLNQKILKATAFLPVDVSYSERVYCIENNIAEPKLCPVTSKPLMWNASKHQYRNVVGAENSKVVIDLKARNKKLSENKLKNNALQRATFLQEFLSGSFILKTKTEVLSWVNQRIQDTDHGRKCHYIDTKHLRENKDIVCSILHYTAHPLLELRHPINWSERFYILTHNLSGPVTCYNDPSKKAPFENSFIGYRKFKSNTARVESVIDSIKENISIQGFKILNNITNLRDSTFQLQCTSCGKVQEKQLSNARWKDIYCPGCFKDIGFSKMEREVCTFLDEHKIAYNTNVKTVIAAGELDIYIPSKQIAIEFNGVLWHSFGSTFPNNIALESKNKHKHAEKTNQCEQVGVQLIQILDSEWLNRQDIVKSLILSKLGVFKQRLYARACTIQEITDTHLQNDLVNTWHLQGASKSTKCVALFYNNAPVALMSFGTRKITGGAPVLELIRFCCAPNTQIIGGASKLFQYFIKTYNPNKIISYADRRISNGGLYKQLGFNLKHISQPNYWYTKNCIDLAHRSQFQKHKIAMTPEDHVKTESTLMYERGYRRIYDCGNYVFEWLNQPSKTKQLAIKETIQV